MSATFRLLLAIALVFIFELNSNVEADSETTTLVEITTLENNCIENICRNFHFDNVSEVAFFDLKAQVRINNDGPLAPLTYDLSSSVQYDTLIFEDSTFAHFPLHFFYSLWVKELDMRHCGIERLIWENFLMTGELRILLLSDNKLEQIEEMTFNYATELQYLFLDSNRLRSLDSKSFKGLTKLKFLDLHNNSLESLPLGVFDHFPDLQELNLAQNLLSSLHDDIFNHIPNVLTLLLSQNSLGELGEYLFEAQQSLLLLDISQNLRLEMLVNNLSCQYIVASNCSLQRVNIYGNVRNVYLSHNQILELYFSQPETLEYLNLRNNSLQQIASLSRAKMLRSLIIADNAELGSLPDPWTVESLEFLDMSNTGLTTLPITSLANIGHLRHLNISSNNISEINPLNFQYLKSLTNFYIHANDWNCFNLNMLMDILIRPNNIVYTRDVYNADFPGEYINGIACMYRLPVAEDADAGNEEDSMQQQSQNYNVLSQSHDEVDALLEVKKLRKELKAIVGFYEQKFSNVFSMITELKQRLDAFEKMNDTMWQHITIAT